ncbi:MAG: phosphate ABC transporter ATP-binding protein [Candidatus Altiarchaeales archaeon]|nr:MAG: phosphate ABC transporter ATP-binding protein [Candidatus Altiarchaeales archaeon]
MRPILEVRDLSIFYGDKEVVKHLSVSIHRGGVTTVMGPSGCGKTTFLRALNRLHDFNTEVKVIGSVILNGNPIDEMDSIELRRRVGMVFQKPNPFPFMNIYDNVIAGFKLNGIRLKKSLADSIVEECLTRAGLWNEVKDDLHKRGSFLSGGQQQRLCIARALAMNPDILLLDEPTSALDPITTAHIEKLMIGLKRDVTILLVTHNIAQANRVSDYLLFMYLGELIEHGNAQDMFSDPKNEMTTRFLAGAFG